MLASHLPTAMAAISFASELKRLRTARRMSQLDLALTCAVSTRHLSFMETGRTKPSRAMVLTLAQGLLLPLGATNALLQTAGFSPEFPASALDSRSLEPFRAMLAEMVARHAPNPALICDQYWTVKDANPAAQSLLAALQGESGETNMVRMLTDSPEAPRVIVNFPEVLQSMRERVQREALEAGDDPIMRDILARLIAIAARYPFEPNTTMRSPLTPLIFRAPQGELRFLSAIAQFGTSEDVTVRDLRLELFFPADAATRAAMEPPVQS